MASRLITDLHPDFQPLARKFVEVCKKKKIDVLIYCTYRSNKEQAVEYAKGRTTVGVNPTKARPLGKIVTNAKPGQSEHNFTLPNGTPASRAFDCVPLTGGKPMWSDTKTYAIMGGIAKDLGFEWSGDWKGSFKELAHFQMSK
jgi:peptidoglycan L-alanyl-D-glutamate endopeptidase CwlK